jgi:GDPmannose 4,6-dehydratase
MDDISYTTAVVKTKLVTINKDFYRPAEVELLLGSHDKILKELGWRPKNSFKDLVKKMVDNDIFLLESSP